MRIVNSNELIYHTRSVLSPRWGDGAVGSRRIVAVSEFLLLLGGLQDLEAAHEGIVN